MLTKNILQQISKDICVNVNVAYSDGKSLKIDFQDSEINFMDQSFLIFKNHLKRICDRLWVWLKDPDPDAQWPEDLLVISFLLFVVNKGIILDVIGLGTIKVGPHSSFQFNNFKESIDKITHFYNSIFDWFDVVFKYPQTLETGAFLRQCLRLRRYYTTGS